MATRGTTERIGEKMVSRTFIASLIFIALMKLLDIQFKIKPETELRWGIFTNGLAQHKQDRPKELWQALTASEATSARSRQRGRLARETPPPPSSSASSFWTQVALWPITKKWAQASGWTAGKSGKTEVDGKREDQSRVQMGERTCDSGLFTLHDLRLINWSHLLGSERWNRRKHSAQWIHHHSREPNERSISKPSETYGLKKVRTIKTFAAYSVLASSKSLQRWTWTQMTGSRATELSRSSWLSKSFGTGELLASRRLNLQNIS